MLSYPNFRISCTLDDFKKKWEYLQKGERDAANEVLVAGMNVHLVLFSGRIINKRSAGSKLFFYDIRSGETMLQVMSSLGNYEYDIEDQTEVVFNENYYF